MTADPLLGREIVFERSMAGGAMTGLADEPKQQLRAPVASDRESHCIASTLLRQPGTTHRVTEIAKFSQFLV